MLLLGRQMESEAAEKEAQKAAEAERLHMLEADYKATLERLQNSMQQAAQQSALQACLAFLMIPWQLPESLGGPMDYNIHRLSYATRVAALPGLVDTRIMVTSMICTCINFPLPRTVVPAQGSGDLA